MKTINAIFKLHKTFQDLYAITINDFVTLTKQTIENPEYKIIFKHLNDLKNINILEGSENNVKWISILPIIEITYYFYYSFCVRNGTKTFSGLIDVFENPNAYSSTDLMEAIAINKMYEKESGKSLIKENDEDIINEELKNLKSSTCEKVISISSTEYMELNEKYQNLVKIHQDLQINHNLLTEEKKILEKNVINNSNDKTIAELIRLLEGFCGNVIKNTNVIREFPSKFDSISGSFRKVIGMLDSIQKNSVRQTKVLYVMLRDIYEEEFHGTTIHESIDKRKEIIEGGLSILNNIITENENNVYIK